MLDLEVTVADEARQRGSSPAAFLRLLVFLCAFVCLSFVVVFVLVLCWTWRSRLPTKLGSEAVAQLLFLGSLCSYVCPFGFEYVEVGPRRTVLRNCMSKETF